MEVSEAIWPTLVFVLQWVVLIGLSVRVIMRRPPIGVALAWLVVIAALPLIGAAFYLSFGEKRLGRARTRRIEETRKLALEHAERVGIPPDAGTEPLMRHADRVWGFHARPGNQLELLTDFQTVFDRLIQDIDAAERSCHLEFYIWADGGRADDVAEALIRAARRGVGCRVMLDAVGSRPFLKGRRPAELRAAGVELTESLPLGPARSLGVRADIRNHRKIAVFDGKVAYTGSQNLVDPRYFKQDSGVGEWVDAMVRIEGPATDSLEQTFLVDWSFEVGQPIEVVEVTQEPPPGERVQVVPSGPSFYPKAISQLLLEAIYLARRELVITTPYFVPDDATVSALVSAGMRGADVTLIVPAKNDSRMVRYASASYYDELLSAGVKIAAFDGGLLHTKSVRVDDRLALFGSVNVDMRSLWLNFEISLFVYSTEFTSRLKTLHDGYLADSELIDLDAWRQRPFRRRFLENSARLIGPLL